MRRLEFAPESREMEVADIATGRFVFRPRPNKPVSLAKLQKEIKNAGYEIAGTRIEVAGALTGDGRLRVPDTGQVFRLEGDAGLRGKASPDGQVTVTGVWATKDGEEVVRLEAPSAGKDRP
ncbi:MAG TPA: hypothetical protein VHC97_23825 [Thermoanaerobaculia bacterium]|nr:hypothetical protein [Thermoanaerobaculia bacterium]